MLYILSEAELAVQQCLADAGIQCPLAVPSCDDQLYSLIELKNFTEEQGSFILVSKISRQFPL